MARQRVRNAEEDLRRADSVLGAVIDDVVRQGGTRPTLPSDPALSNDPNMPTDCYGVLLRGIASQNISAFASRAIYRKLIARFGGRPPTPRQILDDDQDALRLAAGLSHAKTVSLRSLAERILSGDLELDRLHDLPDEDVVAQLSAVKGIGTWTADMFLIWHLNRPDVLPVGDLGIAMPWRSSTSCPRFRALRTWNASRSRGARTGRWRAPTCGAWRNRHPRFSTDTGMYGRWAVWWTGQFEKLSQ